VNPLRAAKQLAAERLAAFLAGCPDDPGLEQRLQDLAMATIYKETEGFLRRNADTDAGSAPEPPWIPSAPAELVDRLAAAGLICHDEKERHWHWTDEWLAGQLAYGAFLRGDGREVAERWRAGFRNARTRVAESAFTHLADDCITGGEREWLELLLKYPLGAAAIAGALALRAPVGDESEIAADLATFAAQLDQVLGPALALQPVAETARAARVMELAADRLAGFEGLTAAHRLLCRRLVEELEQLVEMRPRQTRYVRALAKSYLSAAEAEAQPALAIESCARSLAAWRRVATATPKDPWVRSFLLSLTRFVAELPREGDPERFLTVYAAALAALDGLPEDAATREATLRRQAVLIAWTLDLDREAAPGERLATFERGLARIDQLIALCPGNVGYLEGKQEFLEEFAKFLEATDAPRAESLRAEAQRLAVPDPVEAATESPSGGPSPSTAGPPSPEVQEAPGDGVEGDLDGLRAAIRVATACALEDPVRSIRFADAVVEWIARDVISRGWGPLPRRSSTSQIGSWAASSPIWPARLRYVFMVLEWHRNESRDELASSAAIGSKPGVYCCAAMARVARWYFEEVLRAPVPPEVTSFLEPDLPGASEPAGPRRVRPPDPSARRSGAVGVSAVSPVRARARSRLPTAVNPQRDLEEAPLHPGQIELARQLGVPPRIRDPRTGMAMVLVPGGTIPLRKGSYEDAPRPDLSAYPQLVARICPAYFGIAPVLQEEWSRVSERDPSAFLAQHLPVTDATWEEVIAFLARANEGRTGPPLRLPLEPEWELAARGGTTTDYWWGDGYREGWANCSEDGIGSGLQKPNPPGRFPANPYGLYDVLGNVREWCHGAHFPNLEEFSPFRTALEPAADRHTLLCGGCWQSLPSSIAFSELSTLARFAKYDGSVGFRCVRDLD